jgi:hypothetical protein
MSNDKNFKLVLTITEAEYGTSRKMLAITPKQQDDFKSDWRYAHVPNMVIQHIGGEFCIPRNAILSAEFFPIENGDFESAALDYQIGLNPAAVLQKALVVLMKRAAASELKPIKEDLSTLDKRLDYFVGLLEAKGTPKSQPKQSEDDRALCTVDAQNPSRAKCFIAHEPPTAEERLKAIKRAS